MSIRQQIVAGTIATVIGGVILTVVTPVGELLREGAISLREVLGRTVVLPVWLVLLASACLLAAGIVVVLLWRRGRAGGTSVTPSNDPNELSELQLMLVVLLAREDGRWLSIDDMAREVRERRLVVENAVEDLESRDLLALRANFMHGASYRLSSAGVQFAIDNELIPADSS